MWTLGVLTFYNCDTKISVMAVPGADKAVEKGIMDTIMSAIGSGAEFIGLDQLGAELAKGGLKGLYGGLDSLAGGLLPNIGSAGVDLGAGYLGKLYSGADKLVGGRLPNFGIAGTITPEAAAAARGLAAGAGTTASTGAGATANTMIVPAGSAVPAGYTGSTMGNSGNMLLTKVAAPPSGFRAGVNNFMSYAKPAVGLASAVGTVAALLDGKGSGGNVPTAAKGGKTISPGSSSGGGGVRSRDMNAPASGSEEAGPTSGLDMGTRSVADQVSSAEGSDKDAVTPGENEKGELGATQAVQTIEATNGMATPDLITSEVTETMGNLVANVNETKSTIAEQEEMEENAIRQDVIQEFVAPSPLSPMTQMRVPPIPAMDGSHRYQ